MTINTKYLALLAALLLPASAFAQVTNVTASFDVYKHWNQVGVPDTKSVNIYIVCTAGEPTVAATTISVAQYGTFQIEDIPPGHNCTITEDVPANYTATYSPPGVGGDATAGCLFVDVVEDNYECNITNTPDEGSLTVTKTWVLAGADAGFDGDYKIKASCDTEVTAPSGFDSSDWCWNGTCYAQVKASASLGDHDFEFGIPQPAYGGSDCTIEESFDDSVVESQNGCSDPETIKAGKTCHAKSSTPYSSKAFRL